MNKTYRQLGCWMLLCSVQWPTEALAQLAEKPSAFIAARRAATMPAVAPAGSKPTSTPFVDKIPSREVFDGLARVYDPGTPQAIVHILFAIDRAHGGRVYYINTHRYPLHEDFLRAQYLVANLDHKTVASYYEKPDRRFVLGTLGFQPDLKQWLYEFWEGDRITPALLALTRQRLTDTFFAPTAFKANSVQQEEACRQAGLKPVTEAQIIGGRSFLPLNTGVAQGRLRRVADIEADTEDDIQPTDIVVLRSVALSIPPVAGVVTEKPSTVLSHVNLLVKGWVVPNAYVQNAYDALAPLDGQWVTLKVTDKGYTIELTAKPTSLPRRPASATVRAPNLRQQALLPLAQLNASRADACGGKAANLGHLEAARRAGKLSGTAPVPDGYCIPYAHYVAFSQRPEVAQRIQAALQTEGFERSRAVRRKALEALRNDLVEIPLPAELEATWVQAWQRQLGSVGVFVRSSSNSEDLANFSGAGLYTTVPNVKREADLSRAVKTVWASVFNFEAFETRRHAGIAFDQVAMAVFVQRAIDSVSSGVMITRDPFDVTHANAVYVSAKRGIGIKVVEGRRVAEQSMFDARSGAARRLSRSAEDSELKLDSTGGVVEKPIEPASDVLSEPTVRALARVGRQIKQIMRGVEQGIEWAIDPQGRVVVLQSRPYI